MSVCRRRFSAWNINKTLGRPRVRLLTTPRSSSPARAIRSFSSQPLTNRGLQASPLASGPTRFAGPAGCPGRGQPLLGFCLPDGPRLIWRPIFPGGQIGGLPPAAQPFFYKTLRLVSLLLRNGGHQFSSASMRTKRERKVGSAVRPKPLLRGPRNPPFASPRGLEPTKARGRD